MNTSRKETKSINLALQGGGAHGAFTWGVLDRLLEEERIVIEGISGTSAGALNAAVMADGFEKGGRDAAKAALHRFWESVSVYGAISPYHMSAGVFGWSPLALWFDILSLMLSPYQVNPFNIDPLRTVLAQTIDFERLRCCAKMKLYISATNVNTNHLRVFTAPELSIDALLASTCLPQLRQAVKIDGEYYWDGGFMGNPVLEPLVRFCKSHDIVIVQINPMYRDGVPCTTPEIQDRTNEITFNASLMRELRSMAVITRLVERGEIKDPRVERAYFHHIAAEETMCGLTLHSKLDTDWSFLLRLRESGRRQADEWLKNAFVHLGKRSTLDLKAWEPDHYRRVAQA